MNKTAVTLLVLVFLTGSCIFTHFPINAAPRTIVVPDDYQTVSAAVDHAAEGDTISVKSGRYWILNETLAINKTLSIIGEDASTTFLTGPGSAFGTLEAKNEENNEAKYTLLNAHTSPSNFMPPPKVAFQVNADNFKISHLTVDNCDIGISVSGDGTEISNTKMPGVSVTGSHSIVSDNIIAALTIRGSYQIIKRNSAYREDYSFPPLAGY